jgi:G:T-mismatch repair DNA endonuclease (very short patch repair protein)
MPITVRWGVVVIWECELSDMAGVRSKLVAFLEADT